ncbi:hypothetical protein [Actinoplanes awajinensis]|uniref:Uncharacterized protein n=1 Tax=Actinoplanes awajinensis subsp. mycoplanecinus TaxID=135947 RepID=A0A101JG84_9ACTN|nr:hypothetical protein [Actinoplanes awajinensis]KUL26329.1 hypothetical protein ADL15_38715 [Actinoplanes awajinensis subsp. mycoplanecinus]
MTDTPLSNLMDAHVQADTAETYAAFVAMFQNSCEGILVNSATRLISVIIDRDSVSAFAPGPV